MSFEIRLKKLIDKEFKTQNDIAFKLGVSKVSISTYVNGKQKPKFDILEKFFNLGVNINWLLSGEGSMMRTFINEDELDKYDKIIFDSYFESKLDWYFLDGGYLDSITSEEFDDDGNVILLEDRSNTKMAKDKADVIIFDTYKSNIETALIFKIYHTTYFEKLTDYFKSGSSKSMNTYQLIKYLYEEIIPKINEKFAEKTNDKVEINGTSKLTEEQIIDFYYNLSCLYFLITEAKEFTTNFDKRLKEQEKEKSEEADPMKRKKKISLVETKSMFSFLIDQIENAPYVEAKGNRLAPTMFQMCKLV